MTFKISGYSTALFSTWYFLDEAGLLFDCGDGCTAGLLQKSRKVKNIFISHADRDHLTGLLQFCQLNNREELPKVFYPADCGSFPALNNFSAQFDPHIPKGNWAGLREQEEVRIGKDFIITAIRNNHVSAPQNVYKSLGFLLERTKKKLKEEYTSLSGSQIAELRKTQPGQELMYEVREKLFAYSGDTPVENEKYWDGTDVLIHEATFLNATDMRDENSHGNKHSLLEDVIAMVATININHLVLGHFSPRYDENEIVAAIKEHASKYSLRCPVYAVLPGKQHKNIFENKVYEPGATAAV